MKKSYSASSAGMTLIELLVGLVVGTLVCLIALTFYRHFMNSMERQKQVTAMQDGIRSAVDCINRYLIAGGVSGDSLFFDPHRVLNAPLVNGGHRVFEMKSDSTAIFVYGNYSGSSGTLALPVLDKTKHTMVAHNAKLFKVGGYAYIYAGSAQEVTVIRSIVDSTLTVSHDFFAAYPKGTLVFPLERISISRSDKETLQVSRQDANGSGGFKRSFSPSAHPGDSLSFKIQAVDREAGQISYRLTFTAKTGAPSHTLLARTSDQTVFVRGF